MNIIVQAKDHCTQLSQVFTSVQLAQLIRLYFTGIEGESEAESIALLTTIFHHASRVLFGKSEVPKLISPPEHRETDNNELAVDFDTIRAAENDYDIKLVAQYEQQICKQLAFNVTVFQPAKQVLVNQLLLTSSLSIYLLLDIHRDGISHSIESDSHKKYIEHWVNSILQVLFINDVPTTLEAAISAAQGFELSIDYMGTMALEGQDPLGE